MITVRFPSGFSVQYNSLDWAKFNADGSACLYENSKSTGWIVYVPKGALIEFIQPCRTYNACNADYNDQRLASVEKEMRTLKTAVRKSLKGR